MESLKAATATAGEETIHVDDSYDDDDLPDVGRLFDESILDSLNKELEDLRESFDLLDARGGGSPDVDDEYDSDVADNDVAGGGGGSDNDDDDGNYDDDDSDYDDYDDDDPDSGEKQLFSMMDDLVMQLQMDLKEEFASTDSGTTDDVDHPVLGNETLSTASTPGKAVVETPDQLVCRQSKPRSDSVGTSGSNGSMRTPEEREKGMRLHLQVRSLLKRVTDMTTIGERRDFVAGTNDDDDDDDTITEEAPSQETQNNSDTAERRKRSDPGAAQIQRLLGALESYSLSLPPSSFRKNAFNLITSSEADAVAISADSTGSSQEASAAAPVAAPGSDFTEQNHAKTARAMSSLMQRKRREFLMRKKSQKDGQGAETNNKNEDDNDAERAAEIRSAAIRETIPVQTTPEPLSAEEEQRRRQQQQEKLRQHRQSQEELLKRRTQLLRQQQLLQQKEELLLQHQFMMHQSQQQEQMANHMHGADTNKNKKKKKGRKRTNKHKQRKPKVKTMGPNGCYASHPQQAAVSRKTLQALYAKLLALDEQLSAEYGDCAQ